MKNKIIINCLALVIVLFTLASCGNNAPKPIRYGEDQCAHCRMTVSDMRFGTQLQTKKGRTYQFDDVKCMISYVKTGSISREEVAAFYLPDYINENQLLPAENMFLLKSESLKSPMRGDIAAFANEDDLKTALENYEGETVTWEDLWK